MTAMPELETLLYDESDGVAWVTLNRPQALNAFDPTMQRELRELWQRAPDQRRRPLHRAHRCGRQGVLHRARPRGDRRRSRTSHRASSPGYNTPWDFDDPGKSVCPKTNDLWKPVIAAVNGMACGGAFYILGEVDFIIAVGPGHVLRPARHLRDARRLRADLPAAQDALPGGHAPVAAGGPRADVGRAGPRDRASSPRWCRPRSSRNGHAGRPRPSPTSPSGPSGARCGPCGWASSCPAARRSTTPS